MKIKADAEATLRIIALAREYMKVAIIYGMFAIISIVTYFLFVKSVNVIMIFAISAFGAAFLYHNYRRLQDKQYELDECYIQLSDTYLEYRQLVEGKYQFAKIFLQDITSVMKVEQGFQIWFDLQTENSLVMMDEKVVNVDTVCVNFYAYDTEEYINLYLQFLSKIPDTAEKELESVEWKDENTKLYFIKMVIPCVLYVIPGILSFI